jgi:hypothetical protein
MTAKEALSHIKSLLKTKFSEDSSEQFEAGKLSDGTAIEFTKLEAGGELTIISTDGTKAAAPVGEYELEDARIIVVTEPGLIAEVKEKPAEAADENKPSEMVASLSLQLAELQRTVTSQAVVITNLQTAMQTFKTDTHSVMLQMTDLVETIATEETDSAATPPKQTVFSEQKRKKEEAKTKAREAFAEFSEKLKEKK